MKPSRAIILAALAAGLVMADAAQATMPGLNGPRIVYSRLPNLNGLANDLWAMNVDGSGQAPFVPETDDFGAPADTEWSPDGTRVAFSDITNLSTEFRIVLANADGSGYTPVSTGPAGDTQPAWSPDGTQLAFNGSRDGDSEIFTMNALGGNEVPRTTDPGSDASPTWSPDGSKIAFVSNRNGDSEIFTMNPDGSGQAPLPGDTTPNEVVPDWSPDGSKIVYALSVGGGGSDIWVMNADGSGRTPLATATETESAPTWSPDGTRIVYSRGLISSGNNSDIWVMNADGSGETNLTVTSQQREFSPRWQITLPAATIADASIVEGNTGFLNASLPLSLSPALFTASSLSFATAPGTASAEDFSAASGPVSFAAGSTSAAATVPIAGDTVDEPDETVLVNLSGPFRAAIGDGQATLTIVDDDLPAPVLGRSFNVERVSGKVLVATAKGPQLTGARAASARSAQKGRRFVPLTSPRQLTVGSFLDTRKGRARITTATDLGGRTQRGEFFKGLFQVLQSRSTKRKGMTTMKLKGSSFRSCRSTAGRGKRASLVNANASAKRKLSKRTIRRLGANANGRFRTRGRHSSATVRGTIWVTADRCDGTLTKVRRGKVAVRDFRRKRTIVVKAGKRYLARPR